MSLLRLIYQGLGWIRLGGMAGGVMLGWWLLFGGVHLARIVRQTLREQRDLLASEYLIVNKPVGLAGLLRADTAGFTEAELDDLRRQPFVQSLAPFQAGRFAVRASTGADSVVPGLESDLFLEAVPDEYLDFEPTEWRWAPGMTEVPIVVPRDYLALYNFGYAASRNLPTISESLIRLVRFDLRLEGEGQEAQMTGRIAGFSQRLPTILVPWSFLEWANGRFGPGASRPSRLILQTDRPSDPGLAAYLAARNYQCNAEQLRAGRRASTMRLLLTVVGGFGIVVLGLALWILGLSIELLVIRNTDRLRRLILLGYHPSWLAWHYVGLLGALLVAVNLSALLPLHWLARLAADNLERAGYVVESIALWPTLALMGLVSLGLLAGPGAWIRRQVIRLG